VAVDTRDRRPDIQRERRSAFSHFSHETAFDVDIRQIEAQGLSKYVDAVVASELPGTFWTGMLPQLMDTSSSTSPYFLTYKAAQAKLGDKDQTQEQRTGT
jgi:hypothetical protein